MCSRLKQYNDFVRTDIHDNVLMNPMCSNSFLVQPSSVRVQASDIISPTGRHFSNHPLPERPKASNFDDIFEESDHDLGTILPQDVISFRDNCRP